VRIELVVERVQVDVQPVIIVVEDREPDVAPVLPTSAPHNHDKYRPKHCPLTTLWTVYVAELWAL